MRCRSQNWYSGTCTNKVNRQGLGARDFLSGRSIKSRGILCVFPAQHVKKASQSLPPAGGKGILIIFCRGVYLTENTTQAASVRFVRQRRTNRARGRLQSFCQKRAKPFFDSLSRGILCVFPAFDAEERAKKIRSSAAGDLFRGSQENPAAEKLKAAGFPYKGTTAGWDKLLFGGTQPFAYPQRERRERFASVP